jgi:hypothetical protein
MNQHFLIPPDKGNFHQPPEKLITIKSAADALGIPAWKLSRAAAQGVFPTYRLLNSRRLVKLSEVTAAIENSRQGGGV